MGMFAQLVGVGGKIFFTATFGGAGEIQHAQQNEHQADGKFHGQADARGDHQIKKNDSGAHQNNGDGVAEAPERADQAGVRERAFAADNGGHRDHVIRIGSVAHAQEKSNE